MYFYNEENLAALDRSIRQLNNGETVSFTLPKPEDGDTPFPDQGPENHLLRQRQD